jgi:opacity protein-like surface antigen
VKNLQRLMPILLTLALGLFRLAAGSEARAEGLFYVAPKVMFGQQKADFGAPSLTVRELEGAGYKPVTPGVFKGQALSSDKGLTFGALALGLDFYDSFQVPLRFELEISTRVDAKTHGEVAGYYGDDPSHLIPGENPGGYNRGWVRIYPMGLSYTMHTAFANVYADWHNNTRFTPYVGGGAGLAFITGKASFWSSAESLWSTGATGFGGGPGDVEWTERRTQFAWHLDAGLAFDLTDDFAIDLGYRYLDVGKDLKFSGTLDDFNGDINPLVDAEFETKGPEKIEFKGTHQAVLTFRYKF